VKDTAIIVARVAAITLLILIVPKILVHRDYLNWRRLEFVPFVLAAYVAIELLFLTFRLTASKRHGRNPR
jgi:hypothetical protein